MDKSIVFPISVTFEDGETETYESRDDLETGLEDFDSDLDTACVVSDALGRRVRLKIKLLNIEELALA